MNSKCGVQSKRRCESHESCICTVGFPACGCQNVLDSLFVQKIPPIQCREALSEVSEKQEKQLQLLKGNLERGKKKKKRMQACNTLQQPLLQQQRRKRAATESACTHTHTEAAFGCYLWTSNMVTASGGGKKKKSSN